MAPLPPNQQTFIDGQLQFKVQKQDGSVVDQSIDVMILKTLCDELQDRHFPETAAGEAYRPTPKFLNDLAAELAGYGVADCSPSVAYQLWFAGAQGLEFLKKNTSEQPS
jgi:hypothetical protein